MDEHQGVFQINQKVSTLRPVRGWFDYSVKSEMPAHMVGTIFKIHKLDEQDINNTVYTVQFNKEFGFVDIKHSDLMPIENNDEPDQT